MLGSVHSAYYFKGLSLIGEWQYGYNGYALPGRPSPVSVPLSGFYVTGAYFLTGEHVERRARLSPLRPLFPTRKGQIRGLGAWEAVARVSELRLGSDVFTAGFADPNLWSNSAVTTELGLNWYWNEYFKMYIFWLHGEFGQPVEYRPGGFQKARRHVLAEVPALFLTRTSTRAVIMSTPGITKSPGTPVFPATRGLVFC